MGFYNHGDRREIPNSELLIRFSNIMSLVVNILATKSYDCFVSETHAFQFI